MKRSIPKKLSRYPRILSFALSTYGLGFARVEGVNELADWGVKHAEGNKNAKCLANANRLIDLHQPEVIALEDSSGDDVRRHARIRQLTRQLAALGKQRNIDIALLRRKDVFQSLFADGRGTKRALAEIVAQRFPDELARHMPPKRRPWMKEDYRMAMFEAVALAVAFGRRSRNH